MVGVDIPGNLLVRAGVPLCDGHVRPLVVFCIVPEGKVAAVLAAAAVPKVALAVEVASVGHGPH